MIIIFTLSLSLSFVCCEKFFAKPRFTMETGGIFMARFESQRAGSFKTEIRNAHNGVENFSNSLRKQLFRCKSAKIYRNSYSIKILKTELIGHADFE